VGQGVLAAGIEAELRRQVQPLLCERFRPLVEKFVARLALLNPLIRLVRAGHAFVDGFWQDVEEFRVVGLRVPRAITVPVREFIDTVDELLNTIEQAIEEVVVFIDIYGRECADGNED
jgi:hypothetical protein